jgi:phosphopantetheine--protein transferase-like protein
VRTVTLTLARFTQEDRSEWLHCASALLPEAERERVAAITDPDARALHALGRASLRLIGARAGGGSPDQVAIEVSAAGKPYLADLPDVHVSVAHTGRVVVTAACAYSAVGVDVEQLRPPTTSTRRLARRLFSEAEVSALAEIPEAELADWFVTAWTLKEAIGKALGVGIAPALAGAVLEVRDGAPALTSVWSGPPAGAWTLHVMRAPDGDEKIAVALPAPNIALGSIWRLSVGDLRRALRGEGGS